MSTNTPGLGSKIRGLRKREKMTQAALADRLSISASYLNLMEHDKRPVTAQVLIQIAQIFDVDLKDFGDQGSQKTVSELAEVFGDDLFEGHTISIQDVREFAANSPSVARAVVTMYDSYRELDERFHTIAQRADNELVDRVDAWRLPSEEVSDLLQRNRNYFPALEKAAEGLWKAGNLDRTNLYGSLVDYLQSEHSIQVKIIQTNPGDRAVRRFNEERKLLMLSELLPINTMVFQMAHQIALLEKSDILDAIALDKHLTTDESRSLARVALANYFAGAVVMPYAEFLKAANDVRYDIDVLSHRFRASFEQVAHRLTSMRKPGKEGVAFHFLRVDIAGNISKRFSASGIQFARFSGTCPRWNIAVAFMTPGQIRTQISKMPDGEVYFCVARSVNRGERGFHSPPSMHAICLGCKIEEAHRLVYSDGVNIQQTDTAVPVGVTCRLCERMDCEQRAFPPISRKLEIDENVRGITFYTSPD